MIFCSNALTQTNWYAAPFVFTEHDKTPRLHVKSASYPMMTFVRLHSLACVHLYFVNVVQLTLSHIFWETVYEHLSFHLDFSQVCYHAAYVWLTRTDCRLQNDGGEIPATKIFRCMSWPGESCESFRKSLQCKIYKGWPDPNTASASIELLNAVWNPYVYPIFYIDLASQTYQVEPRIVVIAKCMQWDQCDLGVALRA